MDLKNIFLVAVLLVLLPTTVKSANVSTSSGRITGVSIVPDNFSDYSNTNRSILFIEMNEITPPCGSQSRVAIASDHPSFEHVLKLALEANSTKNNAILGYLDTCTIRSNTPDIAWIRIQ